MKADYRWLNGIWLGVREGAGEYVIGTLEGVVKVRTEKERIARRKMELGGNSTRSEALPGSQFQVDQELR